MIYHHFKQPGFGPLPALDFGEGDSTDQHLAARVLAALAFVFYSPLAGLDLEKAERERERAAAARATSAPREERNPEMSKKQEPEIDGMDFEL
ncbi:MAG: hypothetical protein K2P57_05355 [Burkholderiales bacterium]|nr:hypothetical protein [Burkholderiales bacterium]